MKFILDHIPYSEWERRASYAERMSNFETRILLAAYASETEGAGIINDFSLLNEQQNFIDTVKIHQAHYQSQPTHAVSRLATVARITFDDQLANLNHSVTIAVDFHEKRFLFFDPFAESSDPYCQARDQFKNWLQQAFPDFSFHSNHITKLQYDGYSCSAISCVMAKHLITSKLPLLQAIEKQKVPLELQHLDEKSNQQALFEQQINLEEKFLTNLIIDIQACLRQNFNTAGYTERALIDTSIGIATAITAKVIYCQYWDSHAKSFKLQPTQYRELLAQLQNILVTSDDLSTDIQLATANYFKQLPSQSCALTVEIQLTESKKNIVDWALIIDSQGKALRLAAEALAAKKDEILASDKESVKQNAHVKLFFYLLQQSNQAKDILPLQDLISDLLLVGVAIKPYELKPLIDCYEPPLAYPQDQTLLLKLLEEILALNEIFQSSLCTALFIPIFQKSTEQARNTVKEKINEYCAQGKIKHGATISFFNDIDDKAIQLAIEAKDIATFNKAFTKATIPKDVIHKLSVSQRATLFFNALQISAYTTVEDLLDLCKDLTITGYSNEWEYFLAQAKEQDFDFINAVANTFYLDTTIGDKIAKIKLLARHGISLQKDHLLAIFSDPNLPYYIANALQKKAILNAKITVEDMAAYAQQIVADPLILKNFDDYTKKRYQENAQAFLNGYQPQKPSPKQEPLKTATSELQKRVAPRYIGAQAAGIAVLLIAAVSLGMLGFGVIPGIALASGITLALGILSIALAILSLTLIIHMICRIAKAYAATETMNNKATNPTTVLAHPTQPNNLAIGGNDNYHGIYSKHGAIPPTPTPSNTTPTNTMK